MNQTTQISGERTSGEQSSQSKSKPKLQFELTVSEVSQLTPNMRRIEFSGTSLAKFPDGFVGGYVKFLFHKDGTPVETLADIPEGRPVMRSFTVRAIDQSACKLTIDAAMHDPHGETGEGPAARWVRNVTVGSPLVLIGPGPVKLSEAGADAYALAGDMTALPALACNLEQLPEDATGHCFVEVLSEQDIQPLQKPNGIELHWVVDGESISDDPENSPFVSQIKALDWPQGSVCTWAACEFNKMKAIRQYFRLREVPKGMGYISSYWKAGRTDEEHKQDKKQDTDA
ncbi:MAG: siderophore-interacting protein [Oceanobacter sp.]